MSSTQIKSISVFGLGKLGSPLAAALAHRRFQVIGVDISSKFVEQLNNGIAPVAETGLQEMLSANRVRIRATTDYVDAVQNSEVSCIIVPTPTGPEGTFVLDYVMEAVRQIGQVLAHKDAYHLVVIVSTVMPGDTQHLQAVLESISGKICGKHFGLCYSPEFIALGSVLHDLLNPDMLLIGESDERAGELYETVLLQLTDDKPQVRHMNFVNAELTKLAVNSYVTIKISYANMLARLCERLPDADAQVVNTAVGMDSRIGNKYLIGAMAYGGPCFPRDNLALTKVAERLGTSAPLAEIAHSFNQSQTRFLTNMICRQISSGARVAVLGLAYKPNTPIVEELASLYLIRELLDAGYIVSTYDPVAMPNARLVLDSPIHYAKSLDEAVITADVIIIATAWAVFKTLDPESLRRVGRKVIIVDCWHILNGEEYQDVAHMIYLGKG